MNNQEIKDFLVNSGLASPDPNHPGRLIVKTDRQPIRLGDYQRELIEDPAGPGAKTLSGLWAAFEEWIDDNKDAKADFVFPLMGGDGVPGIAILYKK